MNFSTKEINGAKIVEDCSMPTGLAYLVYPDHMTYPALKSIKWNTVPWWIKIILWFRPPHMDLMGGIVYKSFRGKFYCVDEMPWLCEYTKEEMAKYFKEKYYGSGHP